MLCLSGFELYSRWVPLYEGLEFDNEDDKRTLILFSKSCGAIVSERQTKSTRDTDLTRETKNQTSLWMLTSRPCARWRRRVTSEC